MNTSRRTLPVLLVVLMAAAGIDVRAGNAPPQRPNIVYIMADDQGWKDAGFHGSDIRTPNLDKLAQGGARLEQYYAQPMCTPSRAALMTGRYPHRYGLQTLVIPSAGTYGLATDEWLLPQMLKDAGYRTAIVGKWHLGHADYKYWPRQRGFDYQYGAVLGEIDYFTHSAHGTRDWFRNNKPVNEAGYVTELLGNDAVRLIRQHDTKKPLFLYLAFTAPHSPYQAPQKYVDRYAGIADPSRRSYAAMITAMDDQIGRVVDELDRRGMRDNTLIVFQSDNGGPRDARFTGEVDMSKSVIPADNGKWRGGKASHYEGGTRVLGLANWPGRIAAGSVIDQPMHMVDMYPTLAAFAGASVAKAKPLDGLDMGPTLTEGKPSPRTEVVYGIEPFRAAVRDGDWKLVWQATLPSKVELFNLALDPTESDNVAAAHPARVQALQERAAALAREGVAPLIMSEVIGATRHTLFGSVVTPSEQKMLEQQP
ncbi:arylsulfatase [Variovorax sp. J22P168]|uniref:arylsulfatase B n=1 Tax=Variovorax jilinensis TaxID=3053513 RepID=UPI0025785C51|nr:arylsulfatase [Variovorax sp. J22P168]MDM0015577.1 arylsulfatase [Variovorax sp. J22P168]